MTQLKRNISLKAYNSFGIEAVAKYFFEFNKSSQLLDFISDFNINEFPVFILGGGRNVLFTEDFKGLIIHPNIRGIEIVEEDRHTILVKVGAGEVWDSFVEWTVSNNYYGVENLSHIPGQVGASPVQNIGAYGVESKDVIEKVDAIDIYNISSKEFTNKECRFAYRDSVFKQEYKGRYIITYVYYRLKKKGSLTTHYGNIETELEKVSSINLQSIREVIVNIRKSKLPDPSEIGNAGSFFKNPVLSDDIVNSLKDKYPNMPTYQARNGYTKLAAGWLIDQCGWKGKTIGNAGVHGKQALVLVNTGCASGTEINYLANIIVESVFEKFGVKLDKEVLVL